MQILNRSSHIESVANAQEGTTIRRCLPVLLVVILIADIYLRFYRLTWAGLWSDELFTVAAATQVGGDGFWLAFKSKTIPELTLNDSFLTWKAADNTPPLYELLLIGWSKLFGISDFALRSLSAVIGSLAPLVLYLGLRKPLGEFAAFLGACLYVFSPSAIAYSQEVRAYTLASLFATLATVRLINRVLPGSPATAYPQGWGNSFWIDVLIYVFLAYSHYTGLFLAGLLSGIYFVLVIVPERRYDNALKLLVVPAALVPWIWLSWKAFVFANKGGLGWRDYHVSEIWSVMVPGTLDFYLVGAGTVLLALFLIAVVAALPPAASGAGDGRCDAMTKVSDKRKLQLVLGIVISLCLLFAYSAYNAFHAKMWHARYFSVALPVVFASFAVLFSCSAAGWRLPAGITAILVAFSMPGISNYFGNGEMVKEQYREGAKFISDVAKENVVIVLGWGPNAAFYNHYLRQYLSEDRLHHRIEAVSTLDDARAICQQSLQSETQIVVFQHEGQSPYNQELRACPKLKLIKAKTFRGLLVDVFEVR